jgi:hypothetical protein
MHPDPYQPPRARIDDDVVVEDVEGERRLLLGREAALRTLGAIVALLALGILAFGAYGMSHELANGGLDRFGVALAAILLCLGTSGLATGWGLMLLQPWVKPVVAIGALPVLLVLAPFIAFTGYGVYLVLSARGRQVLAGEQAGKRQRTRHLQARSRPGEAIALGVVLALNVATVAWIVSAVDFPKP